VLGGYAVLGLAVVGALAVGVYLFTGGDDEPEFRGPTGLPTVYANTGPLDPNRPEIGQPAPDFVLRDARDSTIARKLSDFRGQVVILNWYASWCAPCKNEIPLFLKAQEALGDDLIILGVDYLESPEKAAGFLDELGATYPAVLDADGEVARHYRIPGMPTTFFIDRDGVLRGMKAGEVHEQQLVDLLADAGLEWAP
jgi:cytochrome c biogenesis protein CcmG/thiol:disulfide interchange protein DsbE